ncbi:hypothetical protein SALBM311S_03096 [Streptomyces alboniger]
MPRTPNAAVASSGTTGKWLGALVNRGVTTASCSVASSNWALVSDRFEWLEQARVRRT